MGVIFAFVIIYIIASIVLSVIESEVQKNIKTEDEQAVEREKARCMHRWSYQKEEPEMQPKMQPKTDAQIKAEAREKTRKLRLLVYGAITTIVLVITLFNSFFITNEQQIAYTMTFGNATVVETSGLHFKIPFITTSEKFPATSQGMAIGYNLKSNESTPEESLMITSDFNFVNTDFYVEYRISNPIDYKFGSSDPEGILRNIAQASIRNTVGLYGVDAVLTTGRFEIQSIVKEQIIEKLQHHNTGLTILSVTIQDAEPPTSEVSEAFKAVETSKQTAERTVNDAKASEQTKIPAAEAKVDLIIKTAEAAKTERINQATQEVAEFTALYNEYMENPETVKLQLYYNMMEEILPDMEIIIGKDAKVIYVSNGENTNVPTN